MTSIEIALIGAGVLLAAFGILIFRMPTAQTGLLARRHTPSDPSSPIPPKPKAPPAQRPRLLEPNTGILAVDCAISAVNARHAAREYEDIRLRRIIREEIKRSRA